MLKIKIEISNKYIDKNVAGFYEKTERWAFDDNAKIEDLIKRILSKKYLPKYMKFADGWTLYIENREVVYIHNAFLFNKINYYIDKKQLLSYFSNNNSFISAEFIIKTNKIYDVMKLNFAKKKLAHSLKLEKMKELYTEEFKDADIEDIYNKIVELYCSSILCEFELSEIVYMFSTILIDKNEINVEKYIDNMFDELYKVVLDKNNFNKLVQEKYLWLTKKNKERVYNKLSLASR